MKFGSVAKFVAHGRESGQRISGSLKAMQDGRKSLLRGSGKRCDKGERTAFIPPKVASRMPCPSRRGRPQGNAKGATVDMPPGRVFRRHHRAWPLSGRRGGIHLPPSGWQGCKRLPRENQCIWDNLLSEECLKSAGCRTARVNRGDQHAKTPPGRPPHPPGPGQGQRKTI